MCKCGDEATGWTVRGLNPCRSKIFFSLFFSSPPPPQRKLPDRIGGPSSLPFNGYRFFLPGVKRSGREGDHLFPPSFPLYAFMVCTVTDLHFVKGVGLRLSLISVKKYHKNKTKIRPLIVINSWSIQIRLWDRMLFRRVLFQIRVYCSEHIGEK
jgi:hypothetical protein